MTGERRCAARVEVLYSEQDGSGGESLLMDDGYVPEDGRFLCWDRAKARLYGGPREAIEGAQEFVREQMLDAYGSGVWRVVMEVEAV